MLGSICYAQFYNNGTDRYELLNGKTIKYTSEIQKLLLKDWTPTGRVLKKSEFLKSLRVPLQIFPPT